MLDCFEAGAVTLASGVVSPACLVAERGAYSLADWLTRMERNPSAARQKSTLRQLLEAVTYLHGRGMVRLSGALTGTRHDNEVKCTHYGASCSSRLVGGGSMVRTAFQGGKRAGGYTAPAAGGT